jgi:ATP-dependent exoDNAse (exonuclease V) alpha subunit
LITAAAGAGKSAALKPIAAARLEQGWKVYGASLAWQQADDLTKAGIAKRNTYAFSVLLDRFADGSLRLDRTSLLAIDEYSLLGTSQGLELLRYQNRDKFSIIALADPKQIKSVEAGDMVALTKVALGADSIPSIETTQRQKGREAEIAGLLRQGKAKEAIAMKREDGTAIMAHGGRSATVKAAADLYMQRLAETGTAPTVSTPTNETAHQINLAIREAKQAAGHLGPELRRVKATSRREDYVMALAKGDQVRLLKTTGGRYTDGRYADGRETRDGRHTGGRVGNNGTVLTVVSAGDKGLTVTTAEGRTARIDWSSLTEEKTGRMLLAYGYVSTMHRSQGSTIDEHIWVLPEGSAKISGSAGYSAATRHTDKSWLVTNAEAETVAVKKDRPLNDPAPVTDDDRWGYVARRLSWQPEKDTATALATRVETLHRGTVDLLHKVASSQAALDPRQHYKAATGAARVVQARQFDRAWAAAQRAASIIKDAVRNAFERG